MPILLFTTQSFHSNSSSCQDCQKFKFKNSSLDNAVVFFSFSVSANLNVPSRASFPMWTRRFVALISGCCISRLDREFEFYLPQVHNSKSESLNRIPTSKFLVVREEMPVLYRPLFNGLLSYITVVHKQKFWSGITLFSNCDLCIIFVVKLRTALHSTRLWSAVTLLYHLRFLQYISKWTIYCTAESAYQACSQLVLRSAVWAVYF